MKAIVLEGPFNGKDSQFSLTQYSIEEYLNIIQSGDYRLDTQDPRPYVKWEHKETGLTLKYYGLTSD